jgi:hypothetical protein
MPLEEVFHGSEILPAWYFRQLKKNRHNSFALLINASKFLSTAFD